MPKELKNEEIHDPSIDRLYSLFTFYTIALVDDCWHCWCSSSSSCHCHLALLLHHYASLHFMLTYLTLPFVAQFVMQPFVQWYLPSIHPTTMRNSIATLRCRRRRRLSLSHTFSLLSIIPFLRDSGTYKRNIIINNNDVSSSLRGGASSGACHGRRGGR